MFTSVASSDFVDRLRSVRDRILAEHGVDHAGRRSAELLERISRRLSRPPRFAILGEVNSGKTSLANALIGEDLLSTDVIHNSRVPVLLRYAETPSIMLRRSAGETVPLDAATLGLASGPDCLIDVAVPIDALKTFELIDTPGTTAAEEQMCRSVAMARHAHSVIWCTLGTQAWKASEVACARALGARASGHGILAVTHVDLLDVGDQRKVRHRLETETHDHFPAMALVGMGACGAAEDGAERTSSAGLLEIFTAARSAAERVQRERVRVASGLISRFAERLAEGDRRSRTTRHELMTEAAPMLQAAE